MLKKLKIGNYAIIDELEILFAPGLNIITGETGAGKSILMGALGLVLGDRADTSMLSDAQKKCIVEAFFHLPGNAYVAAFLKEKELDEGEDSELIVRREITASGKTRAFVNDTPVGLSDLKKLAGALVDLHQQFDTLEISETAFQQDVVDALAGNQGLLKTYREEFENWARTEKQLTALRTEKESFEAQLGYQQFLYDELSEANFKPGELEKLDLELTAISNSDGIKTALERIYFESKEGERPMVMLIKQLANQAAQFSQYMEGIAALAERLRSVQIELDDIAEEALALSESIGFDEVRTEEINLRIALGYKLLKKHGVKTTDELLAIQENLSAKLQAVLDTDDQIKRLETTAALLRGKAQTLAEKLSRQRQKQVRPLEKEIALLLAQVGMPNASMKVELQTVALNKNGIDQIYFLFDANKSGRYGPISKVASGGELSRLMLCIKSLVAQSIDLPTMIFDEIDTGISGEAAKQVGGILKGIAENRQVVCITHQPQIAGRAQAHFFVYKENLGKRVTTKVKTLSEEERVLAIAKMLTGDTPTPAALVNAREMMGL